MCVNIATARLASLCQIMECEDQSFEKKDQSFEKKRIIKK